MNHYLLCQCKVMKFLVLADRILNPKIFNLQRYKLFLNHGSINLLHLTGNTRVNIVVLGLK